jgi:hypothetical protein
VELMSAIANTMNPITPIAAAKPVVDVRLKALRRFAVAITVLNLFGQFLLKFEPGWIHLFASLATAYGMEVVLELIEAKLSGRPLGWSGGGVAKFVDFFLPAHITGLAVAMLLWAGERVFPVMFGTAVAIGSKALFKVTVGSGRRHFLNPSNTGIAAGLMLLPAMGSSPPYQFTEGVVGVWDWVAPCIVLCTGTLLNSLLTKKMPLILGWLGGFVLQAVIRIVFFGAWPTAVFVPMTGLAFLLFTNYMVSDPATTPIKKWNQVAFGASVALLYGALRAVFHLYYTIFFALTIVCLTRGVYIAIKNVLADRRKARVQAGAVLAAEKLAS